MSELHPSVVAALSRVRRGEGEGGARRAFTVARTEAVLHMRALPRPGAWHFTLALVRAANAVAGGARGFVRERDEGEARVVTLTFSTAGFEYAGVDLQGLVLAAAEGDSDMSEGACSEAQAIAGRWRRLVGAGVNAALAGGPSLVEVRTAAAAVRYVRKDSHAQGQDPYGEQRAPGRCPPQAFEIELRWPRPGFGRRLTTWLSRQAGAEDAVTELWRSTLLGAEPTQTAGQGIELGRPLPGMEVSLGTVGTWGPAPQLGGPWLVREGVKLVSLAPALTRLGVTPAEVAGWVACARLRLTADETSVAIDAGCELLAAWLLDARAHAFNVHGTNNNSAGFVVQWPTEVRYLPTVSGRPAPIEQVEQRCRQGRDLVYVWPHLAEGVPQAIRARVYALWPSELAVVMAAIPEARPVPARALGESPQFERVDLSNLIKSSLPPVVVELGAGAGAMTAEGVRFGLVVQAFVHRFESAQEGSISLLCHERRVAHVREAARAIAGVTLVAALTGETPEALTIDGLRADKGLLGLIAERCREAALRDLGRLLAQAMAHENPWELPLVRAQANASTGATLAVRYRAGQSEDGAAELAWDESPLLGLAVGHDMAGLAVTLQQALVRCREVGGIVVEDPKQRWTTFRSPDPRHEPWELTREGRALLERVAGESVLWDMPTTPEGHLLPGPAGDQERLVLGAGAIEQALAGPRTGAVRAGLRAHLLVAEALGQAAPEVVDLPLLVRYDPRTLEPLKWVSRSDARAERLGLLPPGSGTRGLGGPALLVTPGEAWLLHAAGHPLAAAATVVGAPTGKATRMPVRRAGGVPASLAVLPIADALCLGALRVEGRPAKIAVWGGGLHINDLTLPAPLDWIGGRLALTREGARAGTERLAAQVKALAREVARRGLQERLLHPPGSAQRSGLDAFRDRCAEDRALDGLREQTGVKRHVLESMLSESLKKHPLRRLVGGPRRFEGLLRQALERPIAVERAILSWQAARLDNVDGRAWSIELGGRNAEIQQALAEEATTGVLFAAAALVLGQLFAEARSRQAAGSGLPDELVAGYRLLALLYAHVP